MASSVRFYVPGGAAVVKHPSGRSYTPNASGIVDIPASDAEGTHPAGGIRLCQTGLTADRPQQVPGAMPLRAGTPFFDQSLAAVVFWTGTNWITVAGAVV
jgi:hypothetical protein